MAMDLKFDDCSNPVADHSPWQDLLAEIYETTRSKGKCGHFQDFEDIERIRKCMGLLDERNLTRLEDFVKYLISNIDESKKDEQVAAEFRITGNNFFQKKLFKEALECYNKSILTAEMGSRAKGQTEDPQLPLAYANRSAVLYHLKQYKSCREDIDRAFKHGYPERLKPKLYQRKGQCYSLEDKDFEAMEAFQKVLDLSNLSEQAANELQDLITKCKGVIPKPVDKRGNSCHKDDKKEKAKTAKQFEESEKVSHAFKGVELNFNEKQGRFLTTDVDIKAGDIVIQEDPYVAVLLPMHYDSHCYHCIEPTTLTPTPCPQCRYIRYCSEECQIQSWKAYHWLECPLWPVIKNIDTFSLLSLRIMIKAQSFVGESLEKEKEDLKLRMTGKLPPRMEGCDSTGKYNGDYTSVFNLESHDKKQPHEDIFNFAMTSILLSRLATEPFTRIDTSKDDPPHPDWAYIIEEGSEIQRIRNLLNLEKVHIIKSLMFDQRMLKHEIFIASMILCHMLQLRCNVQAITAMKSTYDETAERNRSFNEVPIETTEQVRLASAVYPTACLMNHACDPNVIASYRGKQLTIRAIKKINKGEEILHCYGPHFQHMCRDERQKALQEQYFFTCGCRACKEESLLAHHHGNKRDTFMCTRCGSAVVVDRDGDPLGHCVNPDCNSYQNLTNAYKLAKQSRKLFSQAVQLLELGEVKDCLAMLHECYDVQKTVLYRHHQHFTETQDCLAKCYAMRGKNQDAIKYLKMSIQSVEFTYGKDSIELANELSKLAQILFNSRAEDEALKVIDRALDIFGVHYGPHHPSCVELFEMQAVLKWSKSQTK